MLTRLTPGTLLAAASVPLTNAQPVSIPAGTFNMGCSAGDSQCDKDEGKPGGIAVKVNAFKIDKYEVSVADYRRCIDAESSSWDENRANLRSSYPNVKFPVSGKAVYGSIGFRCAYDNQ